MRTHNATAAPKLLLTLALCALLLSLAALPALAVSSPATPAAAGPDLAAIDRFVEAQRRGQHLPGLALALVQGDQVVHLQGFGQADPTGRAVTPETPFVLGSLTKSFTALAIMQLVEAGKVELDAPVRRYLPWFRVADEDASARITVRQLLNHTSGLDDFFLHTPIDKALQADPDAFWSVKRTLKYVAKPYFPPGRAWHYSNTNYLYLGLIAEQVTGVPLAVALRERFFVPLQFEATWYLAVEKPRGPLAHGYRFAGARLSSPPIDLSTKAVVAPFRSVVTAAGGAGAIAATSGDAARWGRLLYTGEVLGPGMTAQMLDGVAFTAAYKPRIPYGLGVQAFPIGGRLAVGHSGRLLGFRSAVRHLPAENVTIAVLTNQSRADPAVIVAALLSIVFEPEPPCVRCMQPL